MRKRIYLAGPLFSTAERDFNQSLADFLARIGYEVYVPQEHEPREATARAIFLMDVEAIDMANVVVACVDGSDPDSGTSWECGYAYAREIPVIIFRTDFRLIKEVNNSIVNLMLTESAEAVINATTARVSEIARLISAEISKIGKPK